MIVRVLRIGSDFVSRYDATKSIRVAPSRRCAKQRIEGRQDFRIDRIFFDEQILKILSILKSCLKIPSKKSCQKMIKSYPMTFEAMPCVVLNQIKSIADQCPDEGGFAVFAARAWYRLFEPDSDWEGLDGC